MNLTKFISAKNSTPCRNSSFKKLCSEYSDILPCCDGVVPRAKRFRDRRKILWGKTDCVDLFELKEELLRTKHFKFKTVSWCMFPALKKGDILKITSAKIDDISIGDIPAYRSEGKLYAHRVVDKQIIDGKQFIITRPDGSTDAGDISASGGKNGERIPEEDILGRIEEAKRGRRIFSTDRKKATGRDKLLYKKTVVSLRLTARLRKISEVVLAKAQSFKLYEIFGKKITSKMKSRLNFELAVPFSNEKLRQVYRYMPLNETERMDFFNLKKAEIFHLVIKFNNEPLGCAAILNRPDSCPYKKCRISDVYVRLRYRKLGFSLILLNKTREVLKRMGER